MSIVQMWWADTSTQNAGFNVARCQEHTAAVFGVGLQAMQ
jgi:hypothetical protein